MISEELLSEVLGFEIEWFGEYDTNVIEVRLTGDEQLFINIYELAHKCKGWARDKHDCVVVSRSRYKLDGYDCDLYFDDGDVCEEFISDTEPEAIFKACEWISQNGKV